SQFVFKYKFIDVDNSVSSLIDKELVCIDNFNKYGLTDNSIPLAELVYSDDNWYVIKEINSCSGAIFGDNTNWCKTNETTFNCYIKKGALFVLISKKIESIDPMSRLQFSFESTQFMDKTDKRIDITDFLNKNKGIRALFLTYL